MSEDAGLPGHRGRADPDAARLLIQRQVEQLQGEGVDIELIVRHTHYDAAVAVAAVAELEADVIVCGTRGHSALAGVFLGSFTHALLHIAPCPVLAVRAGEPEIEDKKERKTEVHA